MNRNKPIRNTILLNIGDAKPFVKVERHTSTTGYCIVITLHGIEATQNFGDVVAFKTTKTFTLLY